VHAQSMSGAERSFHLHHAAQAPPARPSYPRKQASNQPSARGRRWRSDGRWRCVRHARVVIDGSCMDGHRSVAPSARVVWGHRRRVSVVSDGLASFPNLACGAGVRQCVRLGRKEKLADLRGGQARSRQVGSACHVACRPHGHVRRSDRFSGFAPWLGSADGFGRLRIYKSLCLPFHAFATRATVLITVEIIMEKLSFMKLFLIPTPKFYSNVWSCTSDRVRKR
jgi:hypothetical protein